MNVKKSQKNFFLILVYSFILSMILAPLRGGYVSIGTLTGSLLSAITGFIVYYVYTYVLSYKYKDKLAPRYITLSIFAGISLVILPIHIIDFKATLVTLPDYVIHLLGITAGSVCFKLKSKLKIIFTVLSITLGAWLSIPGYSMFYHKLNFGTFTGSVDGGRCDFNVETETGDTLILSSLQGKYIVLDCWYSYCGPCFEAFPKVQKLYDDYKDNPDVAIYALHSRIMDQSETVSTGSEILKSENYSFPCLSIDMKNSVLKEFGITVYPTVLIFDKTGKLIFRGNIKSATSYLSKLVG